MYATLIAALVLAQNPPQPQPPQPPQPGQPRPADPTATTSLDGTWTVVAFERNGRPVADADTMSVTIRNGLITFTGGDESARLRPMRLEFAPNGMVRLIETPPADPPGTRPGTTPPDAPKTERPVAPGSTPGVPARTGVYVLTRDFFVLSLNDTPAATDTAARPGTTPPAATPDPRPGTAPRADYTAGYRPTPTATPFAVVILKRSGPGTAPGTDKK
jgi:hypothetical protein